MGSYVPGSATLIPPLRSGTPPAPFTALLGCAKKRTALQTSQRKQSFSKIPRVKILAKTLFIAPLLENQRSVDSCKCKIVAHNILCIHLATFTTNVVQIATFRVNVIQVQSWMEPAYNRRTVKNERASVYLGSSIPRLRARFIERVKILAKLYIQGQCYSSSMLGEPSLQSKNR